MLCYIWQVTEGVHFSSDKIFSQTSRENAVVSAPIRNKHSPLFNVKYCPDLMVDSVVYSEPTVFVSNFIPEIERVLSLSHEHVSRFRFIVNRFFETTFNDTGEGDSFFHWHQSVSVVIIVASIFNQQNVCGCTVTVFSHEKISGINIFRPRSVFG